MKIKTGDKVKVLSGKDRGKTGKVIQVLTHKRTGATLVVVEGVRLTKRHLRARQRGEKGQVIELAAPIQMSKVMLIDPKLNKPTRVGFTKSGEEKRRISKRSGEVIA